MDTKSYQEALEKESSLLIEELASLGIKNPDNPDDWIAIPEADEHTADEIDVADRTEDWDERATQLADLETRYNAVKRAAKKITDGTYGSCEVCNEEIEEERLRANPAARTCILHKEDEINLPL